MEPVTLEHPSLIPLKAKVLFTSKFITFFLFNSEVGVRLRWINIWIIVGAGISYLVR